MKQYKIKLNREQDLIVVFVPERATDFSLFPPGDKFKFWTLVFCLLEGTDYYDAEIIEEKINDVSEKDKLRLLGSWHNLFDELISKKQLKIILEGSYISLRAWNKKPNFPKALHNRKKIKEYREQEKKWLAFQDDVVLILVNKEEKDDNHDEHEHDEHGEHGHHHHKEDKNEKKTNKKHR